MKYIVLLGDGMADYPVAELGGSTPLEVAEKPGMDYLAQHGEVGMVRTVPPGMPPGSDVANLSVLGYDPRVYYTGRSPLEAASMGIELGTDDIAFRCNLVTLSEDSSDYWQRTLIDYSSDEITTEEAGQLIAEIGRRIGSRDHEFYPGISYRHLMVWRNGEDQMTLTPPHDISEKVITPYKPRGVGSAKLAEMMEASFEILNCHPINLDRRKRGLRPANSIWFWGQGRKPHIASFSQKFGLKGAVISAVDLTRGIGTCAGMTVVDVPGATGNIHTNFRGKAEAALETLKNGADFVYIHVEAPDEAGHRGELETKIRAIEAIDREILAYLLDNLGVFDDFRILLLPDHPTPLALRTHVGDPVPFVIFQKSRAKKSGISLYCEESARSQGWMVDEGHTLMNILLERE